MVWFSMAAHALLVFGSVFSMPAQRGIAIPNVITIDLIAAPAPARARPAPPAPRAKPKPKQVVLPERPSLPKPKPRAREEVVLEPKPREEKSLDDLLDQFREEQGEPTPAPPSATVTAEPAPVTASAGVGVPVGAEEMAWIRKAKIHVRNAWVVPPPFRLQSLQTEIVVKLDASGNVKGKPRIVRGSGNPWYDEGVVRSVEKASPLPPPPESGDRTFIFASDDI